MPAMAASSDRNTVKVPAARAFASKLKPLCSKPDNQDGHDVSSVTPVTSGTSCSTTAVELLEVSTHASGVVGFCAEPWPCSTLQALGLFKPPAPDVAGRGSAASSSTDSGCISVGSLALTADAADLEALPRSPDQGMALSCLNNLTSSLRLSGLPRNRGTVSSGTTSWDSGSKLRRYSRIEPFARNRKIISSEVSLQCTLNCFNDPTRGDASGPKSRCSFNSSMNKTVAPSSAKRYSLMVLASAVLFHSSSNSESEPQPLLQVASAVVLATASPCANLAKRSSSAAAALALASSPSLA
mmetsp:Transcript_52755/g.123385  ORF Transcript_52755/g.123385 Transcript_52755/m.123385 type:complete len:298 (-) Transcript_52755:556-1449(-)